MIHPGMPLNAAEYHSSEHRCTRNILWLTALSIVVLFDTATAKAQCYEFISGTTADLKINVQTLPPTVVVTPALTEYDYQTFNGAGNSATFSRGTSTFNSSIPLFILGGGTRSFPMLSESALSLSAYFSNAVTTPIAVANLQSYTKALLPAGLPAVIPAISNWDDAKLLFQDPSGVQTTYPITAIANCNPTVISLAPVVNIPTGASAGGISPTFTYADFNGDGFQDIATANLGDASVSVLFGNGKGGFAAPLKYAAGNGPYGIVAGDFNGDGKPDIAVVNGTDNTISVLLNTGSGGFPSKPNYTYAVGSEPFGVSVADLNKDGFLDLVVSNAYSSTLSVLMGNGNGSFQPQKTYQTNTTPLGTVIADLNNDGYPDVVAWDSGGNQVTVLLNDKTGKLSDMNGYFDSYTIPFGAAIGDFNGDGYPDIVLANLGGGGTAGQYPGNTITVLYGNHLGHYDSFAPQSFTVGSLPTSVVATDLNGDGVLDLAVTNLGDGTVSLLLGKGDGTFMPQTTVPAGTQPYFIVAADFNGDGKPDLAVTSFYDNTVGILLQTSSTAPSSRIIISPKRSGPPVIGQPKQRRP